MNIINDKQTVQTETHFYNGKPFHFNIEKGCNFSEDEYTHGLSRYFIKSKGFRAVGQNKKEEVKQTILQAPKVFHKQSNKLIKKFNKKEE
jgi:hypothetical protein